MECEQRDSVARKVLLLVATDYVTGGHRYGKVSTAFLGASLREIVYPYTCWYPNLQGITSKFDLYFWHLYVVHLCVEQYRATSP